MASKEIVVSKSENEALVPQGLVRSAIRYASRAKARNTRRAYASDWRGFVAWCRGHGAQALPASPRTLALYVTEMAGRQYAVSSIRRALTAISHVHRVAEHPSPTADEKAREVFKGVRRELRVARKQAKPLTPEQIREMIAKLPVSRRGVRDKAMLLVGFTGALRRSEVVAVDVEDLEFTKKGMIILIRKSKTDQEAAGERVGIPFGESPLTCPVRAVRDWVAKAGIKKGPLFREITRGGALRSRRASDRAVDRAVKRAAKAAGLGEGFSGHSLRAGLATTAARAGKSFWAIKRQGRWRSSAMVDLYVREAGLFDDNAAEGVGL